MAYIHIESLDDAGGLEAELHAADRFALDCEAAGFHRYTDRLCLIQVTVGERTYLLDPLAFDPSDLLRGPLEDPAKMVVMHGSDFDLRLLRRYLGIRLRGLIDTQIAAALLGEESLGLAALLEARAGVKLSKKYQRADWAERPLEPGMLEYAASDTRHLLPLADELIGELEQAGRAEWAAEEWTALEGVADGIEEAEPEDPVARVKGARKLPTRQVAALRAALLWRDEIARERDRAPFRVVGDQPLIQAAVEGARRVDDLLEIKGFPKSTARSHGKELLRRLRHVMEQPEEELVGYPKAVRRGPGRPPPELEELVDRLKAIRNRHAEQVGLPRGTLASNALILDVARADPGSLEELLEVPGMRRWKAELLGEALLAELARGP